MKSCNIILIKIGTTLEIICLNNSWKFNTIFKSESGSTFICPNIWSAFLCTPCLALTVDESWNAQTQDPQLRMLLFLFTLRITEYVLQFLSKQEEDAG